MIDLGALNWERIARPSAMFRVFAVPTVEQIDAIVTRLCNDYLYAPDELRDENALLALVRGYWGGANIIYEVGEFQGILGFMDILPEHKASVTLKLWDAERWGRDFVRESRALLSLIMDEFRLVRLSTETPDPRVFKMALLAGFVAEGNREKDFRWNGDYYGTTMMGIVR